MTDYARARRAMVDTQLRPSGVTDRRILAAAGAVPREAFLPEARRPFAYLDTAQPFAPGRALAAPMPLARLLQLAELKADDTLLVVGAAPGYVPALAAPLCRHVVALEADEALAEAMRQRLATLGLANVSVRCGPLLAGDPDGAPFDAIFIAGALPEVPAGLFAQLTAEGRLVAFLAERGTAVAHSFAKRDGPGAGAPSFDAPVPPLPLHRPEPQFLF